MVSKLRIICIILKVIQRYFQIIKKIRKIKDESEEKSKRETRERKSYEKVLKFDEIIIIYHLKLKYKAKLL